MLRSILFPRAAFGLAAFAAVALLSPGAAEATPDFFKEFRKIYAGDDASDEVKKAIKQGKCYVCHQGKSKKNRNTYGMAYKGLITKKDKSKDPEAKQKIIDAIKQVGEMPSVADDESSPTFDELIAAAKLPGGELADLKKEPGEAGSDTKPGSDKK